MNAKNRIRTAVAALSACLAACGGADKPTAQASPILKVSYPIAASAASQVAANDPGPTTPAPVASSPEASAPAQPSGPASTPVVLIDVFGDGALMGMSSQMTVSQQTEPAGAQALLRDRFNDSGIVITNHASGGTSSSLFNELRGVDGNGAPFADRIKTSKAVIVVDNHGVNDALGGETIDDYRQYLAQWVVDVRQAGKVAVLEEPSPVCDGDHPQLAAYVQAMDDAATQFNVPLVKQYEAIQALPNWCSHMTAGFYPDAAVQADKAQREAAILAQLVKTIIGA